ncbi:MAG: hypothetical protein ACUVUQ_04805 [Thermodesulfovibrionales bacterium]
MKKALFWLLIFAFLIYAGLKFGFPYYRYLAFKSDAKEIVKVSVEARDEEELRNKIFERSQELKIPIERNDIEVVRTGRDVIVKTSWFEVVDILGIYKKTLKFYIDTSQ